jgi:hypothetical protein
MSIRLSLVFTALVCCWIWFENSAHFPQWEEPKKFHDVLTQTVVPETHGQ